MPGTEIVALSDLERMSAVMAKSGLYNKTPDQMLALMLIAQAEGLHPAIAAQEYDVIQGRPALSSRSALARFQRAGGQIKYLKRDEAECKVWASHPQGGELVVSWTMETARRAGLAEKDNWKKSPRAMLSARATAEVIRAVYPACLNRMYTADEVGDMDPDEMRNVTPPPAEEPPVPLLLDPAKLRERLAELVLDENLHADGRKQIEETLARPDATPEELAGLIERAESNIAKRKGKAK